MSDYKYKVPEGAKYKVSMREWNRVFGNRGRWPLKTCEVYVDGNIATCHHVVSKFGKLFLLTLSPLYYILGTIDVGFMETHREFKRDLFDKEYGSFSTDVLHRGNIDSWYKLVKLIGGRV